jgi:hypothetical protein
LTYFQIGNLSLPSLWLAVLTTLFGASLFNKLLTGKKVGEWYWNSFFLYFLTWKLSYILFNLRMFLDMPLSIIYFNGGTKGHLLALPVLSLYFLFFTGKKHPSIYKEAASISILFFVTYEVISNLLDKQWIEATCHILIFTVYLLLFLARKRKRKLITGQIFIVMVLIELLLLSIFNTIYSLEALTFTWIAITVLVLSKKMDKEVEKFE